jgi:hypothetical protein
MNHTWPRTKDDPNYRKAFDCPDGNERTERTCARCGLVKITVHPPRGLAWREWRTPEGQTMQLDATPPCLATGLSASPSLADELKEVPAL